jgi:hypothetical protein
MSGENASHTAPSCALDLAASGPRSCATIAEDLGIHRRRVQQLVKAAVRSLGDALITAGEDPTELMRSMQVILEQEGK